MKKVLFSILICIFIGGCSHYQELNDYAIASTLGIDYQNNNYIISLLTTDSSNNKSVNMIYQGKGKTLNDAFKEVSLITPKEIYKGHLSVVILSKNMAKKGISEPIKYLSFEKQLNQDFYVILVKDRSALELLNIINKITDYPSQYLIKTIQTSENMYNSSFTLDYTTVLKHLVNHDNLAINSFSVTKNQNIKLDTIALFKQDKLIKWTNKSENTGINILNNKLHQTNISLECPKGYINININNLKSKIKINKNKDIKATITGDSYIKYAGCNLNNLEDKINKKIKNYILSSIELSQKENIDIFNLGRLYYQNYPKYYHKKDWINNYYKLNIYTSTNIKLKERIANEKSY